MTPEEAARAAWEAHPNNAGKSWVEANAQAEKNRAESAERAKAQAARTPSSQSNQTLLSGPSNGINLNNLLGGSGGGAYVGHADPRFSGRGAILPSAASTGGGGGNVVSPPGTGGGVNPGPVTQNYQQQANPFLTQMLPQYQAYQNKLQGLYDETPADMYAKLRANQSTMRNEQQQQAGQRGGMGMTNAGNWNVNRAEQQQLGQAGLDWKNMSLQNKQAAAGLMGQGLAGASGVAGNIAGNQALMYQNQISGNRLALDAWMAPQQLAVQQQAAQNQGRSSLLSALYPYLQLQSQL